MIPSVQQSACGCRNKQEKALISERTPQVVLMRHGTAEMPGIDPGLRVLTAAWSEHSVSSTEVKVTQAIADGCFSQICLLQLSWKGTKFILGALVDVY